MPLKIKLVPYDPGWPDQYAQEAGLLSAVLSPEIVATHHMGSTSIPGLKSKPVIDLIIEVKDIEAIDEYNDRMIALSYQPMGEYGIAGRRFFRKEINGVRTHHVHIYQVGNAEIARHLRFRDYLLAHPEEAQTYSRLKDALALQHPEDIESYVAGKTAFCCEIEEKARNTSLTNVG
jgi:GrpB-like predicted nucleotidyltransferase (UPF0157 family)